MHEIDRQTLHEILTAQNASERHLKEMKHTGYVIMVAVVAAVIRYFGFI